MCKSKLLRKYNDEKDDFISDISGWSGVILVFVLLILLIELLLL